MTQTTFIQIHPDDNVVVALCPIARNTRLQVGQDIVETAEDIPAGHKVLIKPVEKGGNIIKYGYPIGHAATDLLPGMWINEHNLVTNLAGTLEYQYRPTHPQIDRTPRHLTFKGYERANGEVGIRNEIWIVPTVGCVNGLAERLARTLERETGCRDIDGVHAWGHNYGCSQLSEDHENTRAILRDITLHPNAGAVLVLSLGCENNQPDAFMASLGDYDKSRIRLLVTQRVEGDEFEAGMEILRELYDQASKDRRTEQPLSRLRVGLKCGGSDGFSGITANPLVGRFSDFLVGQGGTTILTEVPEMFGAETILMNRCETPQLFEKTVRMINDFKEYFLRHGEPVGENPSPGNKAGGISTLEDKALGCTQKCGAAPVSGVLGYGERLSADGLNLLSAPGNDLVAATALAASGCQMVLFTTGRGTPFGTFVPTMKISTNNDIASRKPHWIDFNAGVLLDGKTMNETLDRLIETVIAVAEGKLVRNEENGYSEIAIFKTGVTL